MKVLIAISCLLAVASAGYSAYGPAAYAHGAYLAAPQHLPVIGPHGVPLEPAANVAARAQHAAAHAEAQARNGDYAVLAAPLAHVASPYAYAAHAHGAYLAAPQHLPVIGPHGVPLEPAANVAARAQHAASHIEAQARNGDLALVAGHALAGHALAGHAYAAPLAYGAAVYGAHHHVPVIGAHGVPLEPAENVAARAAHAAAHIEAKVRNGDAHLLGRKRRGLIAEPLAYAAHGLIAHQHLPVIGPHGVPLEPAANVAARAAHAAAHAEAAAHSGHGHGIVAAYAPAIGYAAAIHPAHTYPALAHDGQPLETPEVVAAKIGHFQAHAEANARTAHGIYASPYAYAAPLAHYAHAGPVAHVAHVAGVPLDTPEVAAAKAAHFAAHAAAAHGHHY